MVGSTIARPRLPSTPPTRREIVITASDQSSLSSTFLEFHISRTIYDFLQFFPHISIWINTELCHLKGPKKGPKILSEIIDMRRLKKGPKLLSEIIDIWPPKKRTQTFIWNNWHVATIQKIKLYILLSGPSLAVRPNEEQLHHNFCTRIKILCQNKIKVIIARWPTHGADVCQAVEGG